MTQPDGLHWPIGSLSIHGRPLFPTRIGTNPQLSIYGIVNRLAQGLAQRWTGPAVTAV